MVSDAANAERKVETDIGDLEAHATVLLVQCAKKQPARCSGGVDLRRRRLGRCSGAARESF